ncbi:protein lifeguard 1-like [Ylistrum balloti]|uniref:protein lifeguard 1-like n=1 Tax=Ylistrum balloti TaxID=509963 RepID=UPI0029058573|nr:protein lifeguard 1-like [Ylistrum balloti]
MSESHTHPEDPPPSYESVIQNPGGGAPFPPGTEPKDNYNIPTYGAYPVPQPHASYPAPTNSSQPYPTQPASQYPAGTYPQAGYGYPATGVYPMPGQQPQYNVPNSQPYTTGQAPAVFTTNTSLGVNAQNNLRKKRALLCTTVMIAIFIAIIIFIMQIAM